MSDNATCMSETSVTLRVSYCLSDQQVVNLYLLIHVTGRLDQPTSMSKGCALTRRPIYYISMPSIHVFGLACIDHRQFVKLSHDGKYLCYCQLENRPALPHLDHRLFVKLSRDRATMSNRKVIKLCCRTTSVNTTLHFIAGRLCKNPCHSPRQVVKLSAIELLP